MRRKLFCRYHICADTIGRRNGDIKQMSSQLIYSPIWRTIQLQCLVELLAPTKKVVIMGMKTNTYATESKEDTFNPNTVFESYCQQAKVPISNRALLAGFLMLWLKKCVVPTTPREVITIDVYPTVLLVHSQSLRSCRDGELSSMRGTYVSEIRFCQVRMLEDKGSSLPMMSCPYTYLRYLY